MTTMFFFFLFVNAPILYIKTQISKILNIYNYDYKINYTYEIQITKNSNKNLNKNKNLRTFKREIIVFRSFPLSYDIYKTLKS